MAGAIRWPAYTLVQGNTAELGPPLRFSCGAMSRLPLAPLFFLALAAASAAEPAISATRAPTSSPRTPPPTETAAANDAIIVDGERTTSTSPSTAAKITESLPKFSPQKTDDQAPEALAQTAPADALDRPNDIIRLPRFDVRDRETPEFKEREMLTTEGRVGLALQRHPGLRFGPLAFLNRRVALEMLAEEEQLERDAEFRELVTFASFAETTSREAAAVIVRRP